MSLMSSTDLDRSGTTSRTSTVSIGLVSAPFATVDKEPDVEWHEIGSDSIPDGPFSLILETYDWNAVDKAGENLLLSKEGASTDNAGVRIPDGTFPLKFAFSWLSEDGFREGEARVT